MGETWRPTGCEEANVTGHKLPSTPSHHAVTGQETVLAGLPTKARQFHWRERTSHKQPHLVGTLEKRRAMDKIC